MTLQTIIDSAADWWKLRHRRREYWALDRLINSPGQVRQEWFRRRASLARELGYA